MTGKEQVDDECDALLRAEPIPVGLGGEERAEQVFAGLAAARISPYWARVSSSRARLRSRISALAKVSRSSSQRSKKGSAVSSMSSTASR